MSFNPHPHIRAALESQQGEAQLISFLPLVIVVVVADKETKDDGKIEEEKAVKRENIDSFYGLLFASNFHMF